MDISSVPIVLGQVTRLPPTTVQQICLSHMNARTTHSGSTINAEFNSSAHFVDKGVLGKMSGTREVNAQTEDFMEDSGKPMPSIQQEEEAVKKKYGGIVPKKPPLISKDHERAYFDSADWALGKQGVEKPKGPLEALRPKLQPTQQQTRYRKSPCAPAEGEDGNAAPPEDEAAKE
ncbi:uncharacterized protein LOC111385550 isoform X2 [Olea europaea var. sylvestris]|uniref:uncharacterized protein LOC111385550 isoform X2 n=1 Tax=Olea europaea var. sylvestris TaxID=158386 RepID=UPI000C1D579F|nr:uncharacterized protein LOC111385550 isoform X2 [Olea europaea var. sylvestris]